MRQAFQDEVRRCRSHGERLMHKKTKDGRRSAMGRRELKHRILYSAHHFPMVSFSLVTVQMVLEFLIRLIHELLMLLVLRRAGTRQASCEPAYDGPCSFTNRRGFAAGN